MANAAPATGRLVRAPCLGAVVLHLAFAGVAAPTAAVDVRPGIARDVLSMRWPSVSTALVEDLLDKHVYCPFLGTAALPKDTVDRRISIVGVDASLDLGAAER